MTLGATSRLTKISASLYEEFFGTLVADILDGVRKQMETKRKILNSISEEKRKFIMVKSHGIALMFGFGSLSTGRSCCQAVVLCSRVLFHSLALLLQLESLLCNFSFLFSPLVQFYCQDFGSTTWFFASRYFFAFCGHCIRLSKTNIHFIRYPQSHSPALLLGKQDIHNAKRSHLGHFIINCYQLNKNVHYRHEQ